MGQRATGEDLFKREFIRLDGKDLPIPGFHDLMRFHLRRARPPLTTSVHPGHFEILYLASGSQFTVIGGRAIHLKAGEMALVAPGVSHETGGMAIGRGVIYTLHLDLKPPRLLGCSREESDHLRRGLRDVSNPHRTAFPRCADLMDRLFTTFHRLPRPEAVMLARGWLLEIALGAMGRGMDRTAAGISDRVARAMAWAKAHADGAVAIGDLARVSGLSISQFNTVFTRETGIAPRDFVTREKILIARKQLTETRRNVLEIAMGLGFSSSQYFATVFRRTCAMSPLEYRRTGGRVWPTAFMD